MRGPAQDVGAGLRDLGPEDLEDVVRVDALHTGEPKPDYWERIFRDYAEGGRNMVGLGMEQGGTLVGYILGEVRAFEFGSEACGWVFAVGVDPGCLKEGIGSRLLAEACRRFRSLGVDRVRTMVRRNDVPVLAFFRANGFAGGPFVQLEVGLAGEQP